MILLHCDITRTRRSLAACAAACLLALASPGAAEPVPVPAPITLAEAMAAADANFDVQTARNAVATATAGVRSADTSPNPQIGFNAVSIRPDRVGNTGVSRLADDSLRIDQTIEMGGKRRLRVAAARAGLRAAGSDLADAGRSATEAISNGFFALLAAQQRRDVFAAIAANYAQALKLGDTKLRAGAIAGGDFARQKVEALRAETDVSGAEADVREAQLALAVLIGREGDARRLTARGDWPVAVLPAADAVDAIADRRPDVRAADARVEAARQSLAGAHALRHRDLTVGAQIENDPQGLGTTVGFGVSVPLFIGNRFSGDIAAADSQLTQAEAAAAKVRAVAAAEIAVARQGADQAMARRRRYDEDLLPAARHAAKTSEFAYAQGALALLDLLDARRTLQTVELGAIDARNDEARAVARLDAAVTPDPAA